MISIQRFIPVVFFMMGCWAIFENDNISGSIWIGVSAIYSLIVLVWADIKNDIVKIKGE
jgi:hypothetical protein